MSGSSQGTMTVWDFYSGRPVKTLNAHEDGVHSVAFSPDGKKVASGGAEGVTKIWNTETWEMQYALRNKASVFAVAFAQDDKTLAMGEATGDIELWHVDKAEKLDHLGTMDGMVNALSFSPRSDLLAIGDDAGNLKIWDMRTRKWASIRREASGIRCLTFSPDGGTLVAGDQTGVIQLWSVSERRLQASWEGHGGAVKAMAYRPDGRLLASAGLDKRVRLWTAESRKLLADAQGDPYCSVESMSFTADGNVLVLGFACGLVKTWMLCRTIAFISRKS